MYVQHGYGNTGSALLDQTVAMPIRSGVLLLFQEPEAIAEFIPTSRVRWGWGQWGGEV